MRMSLDISSSLLALVVVGGLGGSRVGEHLLDPLHRRRLDVPLHAVPVVRLEELLVLLLQLFPHCQ